MVGDILIIRNLECVSAHFWSLWHCAQSSDAPRQDAKREEEEEKEEQNNQEALLWQQWFRERREEEGETKEGKFTFKYVIMSCEADIWLIWTLIHFRLSGAWIRRSAYEENGGSNAAGWEEEAIQQPAGSQGTNRGGDGGLPHEALPTRRSHGLLPRSMIADVN